MRFFVYLILASLILFSCSSVEYAQIDNSLKGKKVGIVPFDFTGTKKKKHLNTKDTVCFCVGQGMSDALLPYLIKAGFEVTPLFHDEKVTEKEIWRKADSLHLEYIITAKGVVSVTGSSNFIESLNVSMANITTRKVHLAINYSGVAIKTNTAAKKIGTKILQKIH